MDSRKEYKRLWYLRNREKELAKVKENRLEKPELRKSWLKENGNKPKVRFDKARHDANRRKKKWDLTFRQYEELIKDRCYYCGNSIEKEKGVGLDRLDNDKGYQVENVVACCGCCNTSRNRNFTPDEWKVAMDAVSEFRKLGQKC
jgi:hypothetical protein